MKKMSTDLVESNIAIVKLSDKGKVYRVNPARVTIVDKREKNGKHFKKRGRGRPPKLQAA